MQITRNIQRVLSRSSLTPHHSRTSHNLLTTPTTRSASSDSHPSPARSPFASSPAPPRLPPKEQALYETLQSQSTGAFSTPRTAPTVNQASEDMTTTSSPTAAEGPTAQINASVSASGKGEELHPDVRRGAKPEFDGDRNPKTGEVGGPKNEPLRWGDKGDWSYNGRVTDF